MKKHLLLFCLLPALYSSGQTALANGGSGVPGLIEIRDVSGRPFTATATEVKGSPLLSENWGTGYVKFANGRILKDVSLRFNLFNNELYYKLEDIEFVFVDPVTEFSFSYDEKGKSHFAFFRNGYPGTRPGSGTLYYEVLTDGKRYKLLKRNYKSISEAYEFNSIPSRIFRQNGELYIYDAQARALIPVKYKQSLSELVPELSGQLAQLQGNEKGRFKSEKELVELFTQLNL
ncbi:MAG: hypothetical protein V4539_05760 [Bacteroidota bacterium]